MSLKYCSQCATAVEHVIFECPSCKGSMFIHHDPALVPDATALTTVTPLTSQPRVPAPKQLSLEEIKAARLLALDEELGESKVAVYRARMKKELEEIRYRQWRDLQPEWEGIAQNASQETKTPEPHLGASLNGPLATAAGVSIGTVGLRYQLMKMQDELSGEEESNGEDSGIGDFFNNLF